MTDIETLEHAVLDALNDAEYYIKYGGIKPVFDFRKKAFQDFIAKYKRQVHVDHKKFNAMCFAVKAYHSDDVEFVENFEKTIDDIKDKDNG
jgi:hypothetical protein